MYIRFVVGSDGCDHRHLTGVITEARWLLDDGVLASYEEDIVRSAFGSLNASLPCPPFGSQGWPMDVTSWFKSDSPAARESIAVVRELVVVLENHGKLVRVLQSPNPGVVYYEDEFQVVLKQFKHLQSAAPARPRGRRGP